MWAALVEAAAEVVRAFDEPDLTPGERGEALEGLASALYEATGA